METQTAQLLDFRVEIVTSQGCGYHKGILDIYSTLTFS